MSDLTVKQLAMLSGVTVRTLHHYDEIGLLKPAHVGDNGYRYYGRAEALRLQRILFHRELGVPLAEIGGLLEMEEGDQIGVLLRHREKLSAERDRFAELIATIDRTVRQLKGEDEMSNAELYKGFSAEKQADYEAWLIERYGEPMREDIEQSRKVYDATSESDRAALMSELQTLETALADAMRNGVGPEAAALTGLLSRHRSWVATMWGKACSLEAYAGLADLYLSHPDFEARYESIEPGFTRWLTDAMKAYAVREA